MVMQVRGSRSRMTMMSSSRRVNCYVELQRISRSLLGAAKTIRSYNATRSYNELPRSYDGSLGALITFSAPDYYDQCHIMINIKHNSDKSMVEGGKRGGEGYLRYFLMSCFSGPRTFCRCCKQNKLSTLTRLVMRKMTCVVSY